MIECSVQNITKSFGANKIFENISFEVKTKEKIGLIGPNGVGKSTVLKILTGEEDCEGEISFRKGVTAGYLEQSPVYEDKYTGEDVLNLAFANLDDIKSRLKELELLMADENEAVKIMDDYSDLLAEYEHKGGYETQEKFSKVVGGLKITDSMLNTGFNKLSGGEKTKIILGKILLEEPPLLLLDEPSNHLDLSTMEWLERYISHYSGAVIIVSHDRYFLDKAVTKIIELSSNAAYEFYGNYTYFVDEKKRRYEEAYKKYKQNQKDIKRVEEQIKRYRIWGAMRDSEKMYAQAKQLERRLDKMEKLDRPVLENEKLKLKAKESRRSGNDVMIAKDVSKTFGSNRLFSNVDLNVYYKDSLAILGDNGCGKTTLLNILTNRLEPDCGSIKLGTNINIGYIAQNISFSDDEKTILEYFQYKYNINNSDARQELARVLFTGDDVFKKIKVLSGGEKSRLRICSLMYENVNLMVLDEPTNHLDIESREILEDILNEYNGTIIFVSHDRYFIKKVARRISVIDNKRLKIYNGGYEYYLNEIQKQKDADIKIAETKTNFDKKLKTKNQDTIKKSSIARIEKKISAMEAEIESIEEILAQVYAEMLKYGDNLEKLNVLAETKKELSKELDTKINIWEELTKEMECIR